ncbi:helicase (plasmid) [Neorhizobium sp. NCHU2750]|nr:helicase [Neorhizobium sp. NCHU2750]
MAHDLSLAQSHAFDLRNDLMVPITLFKSRNEFGVLPVRRTR